MVDAAYLYEAIASTAVVLFLVVLNGFFVATEFAIVKVRATQIGTGVNARTTAARHVVEHLDAYLSACQLGITIASLALGWIGEPAVSHLFVEPVLGRFLGPDATVAVSFAVAFFIITALHIVVGELAPKTVAIRKPLTTALWVAVPIRAFRKLFSPLIWLLNGSANALVRALGVAAGQGAEEEHTFDEIQTLLARAAPKDKHQRKSAEAASRLFGLSELQLRDIMVPRDRMVYLDVRQTFEDNLRVVEQHPFTRYPLTDAGPDSILGFVHQRDVFAGAKKDPPPRIDNLLRDVHVVPTTQSASRALFDMLEKRRPLSVVVNEFGTTVGMLTLEDIFEEMVGDIPSEFERTDPRIRLVAPGHYLVDASLPVHELQVVLREPLEESGASTLAGVLNQAFGRIPRKGETVRIGQYMYWVKEADRQRARLVEIRRTEKGADESVPPSGAGQTLS